MKLKLAWIIATTALVGCGQPSEQETLPFVEAQGEPPASKEAATPEVAKPTDGGATSVQGPQIGGDVPEIEKDKLAEDKDVVEITWDDLDCGFETDIVIITESMIPDRVRELAGKRVRIRGVMLADGRNKDIDDFVLIDRERMGFGPQGDADALMHVELKDGLTTEYRGSAYKHEVTGILKINLFEGPDGNTWSMFDLLGDRVTVVDRRLDED